VSEQQRDEKVGALWSKSSARGEYFTGNLELKPEQIKELMDHDGKLQIVVFRNDKKTGKQPDWRILRSKPKATDGSVARGSMAVSDVTDQDVPF
jgi:hypothetical protein